MPGWADIHMLLESEFTQSREEGKSPDAIDAIRERARSAHDERELEGLHAELLALPVRAGFGYDEPNDLESIRALSLGAKAFPRTDAARDTLFDKLHGAWLGRCVGCALGKPVEAYMGRYNGLSSWQRQRTYLTAISADEWPLRGYVPEASPAVELTGALWSPQSTRERIAFMESDDDIRYTVIGQLIMQKYGASFTSANVARTWLERLPYNQVCTAETQAYRNIVVRFDQLRDQDPAFERVDPESSIVWSYTAETLNPYREWIGAQIRVDSYAYAAPGDPGLAADYAYRDARISHTKNGIYGAMFCAALIAAAFACDDVHEIVEAGLAQIPTTSRLYEAIRTTIELCARYDGDFTRHDEVIQELYSNFEHYNPVHTINNAAVVVAAILLSRGDFDKAVTFAVMAGWDTDCNGATVGSIMGAFGTADGIPARWAEPLHNTLNSLIAGYHPIEITECANRSVVVVEGLREAARAPEPEHP